jgi:hypothetical protein
MKPTPLMVLELRAWARARLYGEGDFDLEQALHPLYGYAIESGIVHEFGIDYARAIVRDAFDGIAEL